MQRTKQLFIYVKVSISFYLMRQTYLSGENQITALLKLRYFLQWALYKNDVVFFRIVRATSVNRSEVRHCA